MKPNNSFLDSVTQMLYDSGLITARICSQTLQLNEQCVERFFSGEQSALSHEDAERVSFLAGSLNAFVRDVSIEESIQDHTNVLHQSGFTDSQIAAWLGLSIDSFRQMFTDPANQPGSEVLECSDKLSRLTTTVLANRNGQAYPES
ncbi:hypothetical protein [Bifidobacterium sp. ESL0704]|uniref:hypothetical protein n=1 Tax=Bifidobacterium sp. ESL0704 TaxID=2983219 RepID=UPI0023F91336|nr:hypothetical protein [Bifidobacterium sp. ESL0704]WEV53618.1 hypothetical protein OZX64_03925 [Bifidobacterium sp. ESL0704]